MALPRVPFDVAEEIIDQAADRCTSLCNLALTCRDFSHRSRYHLLTRYARFQDRTQLYDFYAYLEAKPHLCPLIRYVTLGNRCDQGMPSKTGGLLNMVPTSFFLKLPNLQHLRIQWSVDKGFSLRLRPLQLICLQPYTGSITTLDIDSVSFRNPIEFARFLLAFPGIRSLRLSCVVSETDVIEIPGPSRLVRERLASQLHLTSLHIGPFVDRSLVTLLMEIGQSWLEDIELHLLGRPDFSREWFYPLASRMSPLCSVTIKLTKVHLNDVWAAPGFQSIVDALELIQYLPSYPSCTYTIVVDSLVHLVAMLSMERIGGTCRELERFFLGQSSQPSKLWRRIVFEGSRNKRPKQTFWMTTLGRHFPELHRRGLLEVRCCWADDAYPHDGHHDDAVSSLAVSPDSKWIASGSQDTTIVLWDAHHCSVFREWVAHKDRVSCITFSPDSSLVVSGCDDGSLVIWDISTGNRIRTLEGRAKGVRTCVWSPSGTFLVSGHEDGAALVWDAKSSAPRYRIRNFWPKRSHYDRRVHFSPDGRWLVFSGHITCLWAWDTKTRCLYRILPSDHPFGFNGLIACDPTGRQLAAVGENKSICIWDIETQAKIRTLRTRSEVSDVIFSPSGQWVLYTCENGSAKIWDPRTGKAILSLKGHTDRACKACFSPDEKYVVSASKDRTVRLWRTSDGLCVRTFSRDVGSGCVEHVSFSPDGAILCLGTNNGSVVILRVRDIDTGPTDSDSELH